MINYFIDIKPDKLRIEKENNTKENKNNKPISTKYKTRTGFEAKQRIK